MASKKIIWSKRASLEFTDVLTFYNERNTSTEYSMKLVLQTEDHLNALSKNEDLGRLTENKKTRVLVMDVFLIFYEVMETRIEILSFWDNRQNPENRVVK